MRRCSLLPSPPRAGERGDKTKVSTGVWIRPAARPGLARYAQAAWVCAFLAFFTFVGVLAYLRVHKTILNSLDERGARIKAEIEEARRLKVEAEALLAESNRKLTEADREAESLVAGAKAEAERLALEAKAKLARLKGKS